MEKYSLQDGVVFYVEKGLCVDIDIDDDVTEVIWQHVTKYGTEFRLRPVMKCFPNVKKFVIEENVIQLQLSNFMFPNVREIKSNTWVYMSGAYLINNNKRLLNTFCLNEYETVDFSGIENIDDYALEGCRSSNFINMDVDYCDKLSFNGMPCTIKNLGCNRAFNIGNAVVNPNVNGDTIIFPDDVDDIKHILCDTEEMQGKTIVVHRKETMEILSYHYRYYNNISRLKLYADMSFEEMKEYLNRWNLEYIELDEHNPYCKTVDSIIYTKNGKVLCRCPQAKSGQVVIPDGVERIMSNAFNSCDNITSVIIPDSVRTLEAGSFRECHNIEYIKIGAGISYIPELCFYRCQKLKRVDFLQHIECFGINAFNGCNCLESISIDDSCKVIETGAFLDCFNLKEIKIPKNTCLGYSSISDIQNVYIAGQEQVDADMVKALFNILSTYYAYQYRETYNENINILNLYVGDRCLCIPRCLRQSQMEELLANPSLLLDEDYVCGLFKQINDTQFKQDICYKAYKLSHNPVLEKYLRIAAKNIAHRMVYNKEEDNLVELLRYDWISNNALDEILADSQKCELTNASAYILDLKNKKNNSKKGFSL